jgi:hypothetical protein
VCETIGFCNANNLPGCIVAIDQAKAFDTISNRYMLEVYKLFWFSGKHDQSSDGTWFQPHCDN